MIILPRHYFFIILVYFAVALCAASIPSIGGSTEAREAQVMDTIVRTGEWVLPLRNGIVPSKPPLAHWIGASIGLVVGEVTEWVARVPSALAASLCLLITILIGREIGGDRGPRIGLISGALLTLSYGFFSLAIDARVDMVMALFTTCAIGSLIVGIVRRTDQGSIAPYWWWTFWGASGLAVLAKGPLGIVLPSLIGLGVLAVQFGPRRACRSFFTPRFSWLLAGMLSIGWYLLAFSVAGQEFVGRQLYFENLKRFSGGEFVNAKPWWFYAGVFIQTAFPWSCISVFAAWKWLRERGVIYGLSYRRMLLVWIGLGLLFFSAATGKRDAYLLPLLPAVVLVSGWYLVDLFYASSEHVRGRLARIPSFIGTVLVVVAFPIVAIAGGSRIVPLLTDPLFAVVQSMIAADGNRIVFVGSVLIVIGWFLARDRRAASFAQWSLGWFALVTLLFLGLAFGLKIKYDLKNYKTVAHDILSLVGERNITAVKHTYDELFDPVFYHLHRPVRIASEPPEVCDGYLLTRRSSFVRLSMIERSSEERVAAQDAIVYRASPIPDVIVADPSREMVLVSCEKLAQ